MITGFNEIVSRGTYKVFYAHREGVIHAMHLPSLIHTQELVNGIQHVLE